MLHSVILIILTHTRNTRHHVSRLCLECFQWFFLKGKKTHGAPSKQVKAEVFWEPGRRGERKISEFFLIPFRISLSHLKLLFKNRLSALHLFTGFYLFLNWFRCVIVKLENLWKYLKNFTGNFLFPIEKCWKTKGKELKNEDAKYQNRIFD